MERRAEQVLCEGTLQEAFMAAERRVVFFVARKKEADVCV